MPEITSILIEKPDPEGPMGAKGLGEHVLIPTAPAILNAIRHATGARLTETPVLPHRLLRAIAEVEENSDEESNAPSCTSNTGTNFASDAGGGT